MTTLPHIRAKAQDGGRLTEAECLWLFERAPLPALQEMAAAVRRRINGGNAYFNRNIHIEPTNICGNGCLFCAFAKRRASEQGAFALTPAQVQSRAQEYQAARLTEVHITGGVHPQWGLEYYLQILAAVHCALPAVHIKAFTAEEVWKMSIAAGLDAAQTLLRLQNGGLGSLAGGGAEILDDDIRAKICPQKINSAQWLAVHRAAHLAGVKSNATMLYGHIETYPQRALHLARLRALQDHTHGFNAFIPLKYKKTTSAMPVPAETGLDEELRNMAVCRIFLDNIPHLKAYLPAAGVNAAAPLLLYGADDLDGVIDNGTKIYDTPNATGIEALRQMCAQAGLRLRERNSNYEVID